MISNHLNNPFINSKASDDNFDKMAETHLERLKADNVNNRYEALLAATTAPYQAFVQDMKAGSSSNSYKKGTTLSNNQAKAEFIRYVARKEGSIKDTFYEEPAIYEEFFPKGMKEYHEASKNNLKTLGERFVSVAQKYSHRLGSDLANGAQSRLNNYLNTRSAQLNAVGGVKGNSEAAQDSRETLAIQLYKNLLTLLLLNVETPDKVSRYFDESFIKKVKKKIETPKTVPTKG